MSKSRSKIVRALRHLNTQEPTTMSVWCFDGLCKGEVFQAAAGTTVLRIATPQNHYYKLAAYGITDKLTSNGERVAIFLRGLPR